MADNEPSKHPRIDFYVSKDTNAQFALQTSCRIVEKALSAGHRIHVHMIDDKECEKLDAMMWTFRDLSFIPHEISPVPIADCPVTISAEKSPDMTSGHTDMLLNVTYEIPENFMQFQRIAEIIDHQPESINAGRERYRFYRENGLEPQHHEVSST